MLRHEGFCHERERTGNPGLSRGVLSGFSVIFYYSLFRFGSICPSYVTTDRVLMYRARFDNTMQHKCRLSGLASELVRVR